MDNRKRPSAGRSCIVAREGWVFIAVPAVSALIFFVKGWLYLAFPLLFITLFITYFFRNPERVHPKGDDIILSPADGKVVEVRDLAANDYTNGPAKKVGVFMTLMDVHVNRSPVAGRVANIRYYPGRFFNASTDKASENNERNALIIEKDGVRIAVVQIAGVIARRIVCYLSEGDSVGMGERLGLIRFGSRVDLYLPPETEIGVLVGDKVKAGVTVIGRFSSEQR